MGKFSNTKRLTKKEQEVLFIRFAQTLANLKNSVEAASLMKDLLSEQEVYMFARRLQIADLLNQGYTYDKIKKTMRVGDNTIAKIQFWLNNYGEGFRAVLKRGRKKSNKEEKKFIRDPWRKAKRNYPMYFWPQMLLKEIICSINKKERKRLLKVVNQMKEKTKLSKELSKLLTP